MQNPQSKVKDQTKGQTKVVYFKVLIHSADENGGPGADADARMSGGIADERKKARRLAAKIDKLGKRGREEGEGGDADGGTAMRRQRARSAPTVRWSEGGLAAFDRAQRTQRRSNDNGNGPA